MKIDIAHGFYALLKNPAAIVVAAWLVRELWGSYKDKNKEHTRALRENTQEMQKLAQIIVKLETKIEALEREVFTK